MVDALGPVSETVLEVVSGAFGRRHAQVDLVVDRAPVVKTGQENK